MIYNKMSANNATIYARTCDILQEQMNKGLALKVVEIVLNTEQTQVDQANLDAALIMPIAVNASFSCELFLKALIDGDVRSHKLDDLFGRLDNDEQEKVKRLTIIGMASTKASYDENSFNADLTAFSNAFVDDRYFHEANGTLQIGYPFIVKFMKALLSVVQEESRAGNVVD